MNNVLISVIVPVFNAASQVKDCIDSIVAQSYPQFELLLINDGSEDDTAAICEEYSRQDSRIKVFHKSNGGVSSARNMGILKSKGDHIVFCDADDQIDPRYFEKMLSYSHYDIVLCSFSTLPNGTERTFPEESFTSASQIGDCLEKHIYTGFSMPWAKLYRRQIILDNQLLFDENITSGEDTLWVAEYLAYVKSIKLLSFTGYHYYRDDQLTLSGKGVSEETMDETIEKIVSSYNNLEISFGSDLTVWKLNVTMYFFHRYILTLSTHKFGEILSKLRANAEKANIRPIFFDKDLVLKGGRLKIFNYMARNHMYLPLAIYVKSQKRYL